MLLSMPAGFGRYEPRDNRGVRSVERRDWPELRVRRPTKRCSRLPRFCDVTCDVTLASMPLQVVANGCYEGQVISGPNRSRALRLCNLRLLVLIPSYRAL